MRSRSGGVPPAAETDRFRLIGRTAVFLVTDTYLAAGFIPTVVGVCGEMRTCARFTDVIWLSGGSQMQMPTARDEEVARFLAADLAREENERGRRLPGSTRGIVRQEADILATRLSQLAGEVAAGTLRGRAFVAAFARHLDRERHGPASMEGVPEMHVRPPYGNCKVCGRIGDDCTGVPRDAEPTAPQLELLRRMYSAETLGEVLLRDTHDGTFRFATPAGTPLSHLAPFPVRKPTMHAMHRAGWVQISPRRADLTPRGRELAAADVEGLDAEVVNAPVPSGTSADPEALTAAT